jgi:Family of unknown function (DUF6011)
MSISPKQAYWADRLLAERQVSPELRAEVERRCCSAATPRDFSPVMDRLFALPRAQRPGTKPVSELEEGKLYIVTVDGAMTVYKTKRSQTTRKLYAMVLDTTTQKFEYDPRAIYNIPADAWPATVDEMLAFGHAYGICVKGHPLTDPLSVELGLGPDCCKTLTGMTQRQLKRSREAQRELATA